MRIFDRDSKLNFVDDHNAVLGFDSYQSCCETWGYFFDPVPQTEIPLISPEDPPAETLAPYRFDTSFFQRVSAPGSHVDEVAIFRLIADQHAPLYLHLFNSHNGYYSHGFELNVGGTTLQEGAL